MKNLFGINITKSKNNNLIDGEEFISKRLSPELQNKLDMGLGEYLHFEKMQRLPLPLTIIQIISSIFLAITFISDIRILFEQEPTFIEAYHNASYIYWAEIINILVFISIKIFQIYKKRKAIKIYEEYLKVKKTNTPEEDYDKIVEKAAAELEIPDEPQLIDFLMFRYKTKEDKDKLVSFGFYDYKNIEYMVYIRDGNLCIADLDFVMSIPLSSMNHIIKSKNVQYFRIGIKQKVITAKNIKNIK